MLIELRERIERDERMYTVDDADTAADTTPTTAIMPVILDPAFSDPEGTSELPTPLTRRHV